MVKELSFQIPVQIPTDRVDELKEKLLTALSIKLEVEGTRFHRIIHLTIYDEMDEGAILELGMFIGQILYT